MRDTLALYRGSATQPLSPPGDRISPNGAARLPSPEARRLQTPRWTWLDWALALLMTLVGALVRWRALQLVPTLTDETDEIQYALRIAQGGFWPLVSVDPYNGPLHHYLLALGAALGGGPAWPRLLALTLGALTVGVTYLLGVSLSLAGRPRFRARARLAGLIAAGLLAVSFTPVVVNSHLAWSNASTPFWTSLALLALSETVRRDRPAWLWLVGLLAGLAAQTHPTALVPLLGGAAWLVWARPRWLRTGWPYLGLAVALLAVSNLIIYNLMTGGGSAAGAARRDYAFTGGVTLADYLANAQGFVSLAYQMLGSTFLSTLSPQAQPAALQQPAPILYALTALAALLYTTMRRQSALPLWVWLAGLLVLPLINHAYDSHISARYMSPLLPPTFAALGALLAVGWGWLGPLRPRLALGLGAAALTVALLVLPALRLNDYYYWELRDGRNNARLWQISAALREPGRQGRTIWLDRGLRDLKLDAGGHVYKALGTLLDLQRTPHNNPRVEELPAAPPGALLVLTDAQRDALASQLRLEPVDIGPPPANAAPGGYWLYRVRP